MIEHKTLGEAMAVDYAKSTDAAVYELTVVMSLDVKSQNWLEWPDTIKSQVYTHIARLQTSLPGKPTAVVNSHLRPYKRGDKNTVGVVTAVFNG